MFELKTKNGVVFAETLTEIQKLVDFGKAFPTTPIRKVGGDKWNQLSRVRGLRFLGGDESEKEFTSANVGNEVPRPKQRNSPPAKQTRLINSRSDDELDGGTHNAIVSCRQIEECAFEVMGDYDELQRAVTIAMMQCGGTIVSESAENGVIEAKWRSGLNLWGLRVTARFNSLDSGEIQLSLRGSYKDSLDTFGKAKKKALEVSKAFSIAIPPNVEMKTATRRVGPPPHPTSHSFSSYPTHRNSSVTAVPHQGKTKGLTILLCLLGGGIGLHKFYYGSFGWGIVYLLGVMTVVPLIVSCVELIILITMTRETFDQRYNYTPATPFKW
jgi:TM2 domain-containing membrane protein YozV